MRGDIRYQGRFLALAEIDGWEYCQRVNSTAVVTIVAVSPEDKVLLVEQYRAPVAAPVIEMAAGLVGDEADGSEPPVAAARRELLEETGYQAGSLRHLGRGPSSAGLTSEVIEFYLAEELERQGPGGGTGSEDITVHEVSRDRIAAWLQERADEGCLIDPKVYAGLWWLDQLKPR